MVTKIFCDVCGDLIPEEAQGEGEDTGQLLMGFGAFGEKPRKVYFHMDALCKKCLDHIFIVIDDEIKRLKKEVEAHQ